MWLNTFIQGLAKLWGGINTSALQCIGEQGKIEERKIKTEEQSVQSSVQRGISREVVERYQCSVERRAVCKEVSVQCKVAAKWEALDAALVVTNTHSARLFVIVIIIIAVVVAIITIVILITIIIIITIIIKIITMITIITIIITIINLITIITIIIIVRSGEERVPVVHGCRQLLDTQVTL